MGMEYGVWGWGWEVKVNPTWHASRYLKSYFQFALKVIHI